MKYANVIFPIAFDAPFTYAVPGELQTVIEPGHVVLCSLRRKMQYGVVVSEAATHTLDPKIKYLPVIDIFDPAFRVPEPLLSLAKWISDYYLCTLGEALSVILPPGILTAEELEVIKISTTDPVVNLSPVKRTILESIPVNKPVSLVRLRKTLGKKSIRTHINELENMGLVRTIRKVSQKGGKVRSEMWYRLKQTDKSVLMQSIRPNALVQKGIVNLLNINEGNWIPKNIILASFPAAQGALKRLLELQIIESEERQVLRDTSTAFKKRLKFFPLNSEQQQVLDSLQNCVTEQKFKGALLWGVTGSGKTRVYLELAKKAMKHGKQVLILAPEISLTPQLLSRFETFLDEKVWSFHSKLNVNERFDVYRGLINGEIKVVVGARSAVFLPLSNPGLIVIDEEHESSFKQTDKNPRYHARDIALLRAITEKCLFVAGSATPSMESLYLAQNNKISLFRLTNRAKNTPLPRIHIVDLNHAAINQETDVQLSETLVTELQRRALLKEKALLFKNRRGYAPYVQCADCGDIFRCPNCDITLTFHKHSKKIECHYCGHETTDFFQCPSCHGYNLKIRGSGTEKIEEKLAGIFRNFPVVRMDRDTTSGKKGHEKIIREFDELESGILLGTKMVTKGHDFENLTLVGVLNADSELNFPDFRAMERGIQSLIQVSGRGGRELERGMALLQTYDPDNPVFEWIRKHDYEAFANRELALRKKLSYPPYSRLILFKFLSHDRNTAWYAAESLSEKLREILSEKGDILGPSFAPLERLKDNYRVHILVKISREQDALTVSLKKHLKAYLLNNMDKNGHFRLIIDVDPAEIY